MTTRLLLILACCVFAFSAFAARTEGDSPAAAIAVPARDLARGTVITADDLTLMPLPATRVNDTIVRDMAGAIGKQTRRGLRAGEVMRMSDLKRPAIVAKGASVTMIFETKGMTLTTLGRAQAEGGLGEVITVLNASSYRKVEATVIAPGMVRVAAPRLPPSLNDVAAVQP